MGNIKFSKICAVALVSAPMLLQYIFIIDIVLLPEYLIAGLLALALLNAPVIDFMVFRWILAYLFFVFASILISILFYDHINAVLAGTTYVRFFFYSMVLIFLSYRYFDIDTAAKVLIFLAVINAGYGLLQYFAYTYSGVVLPWHLPFLTVHYGTELIAEQDYYFTTFGFRFSGLFSEPAHLSQYVSFALYILVFYKSPSFNPSVTAKLLCGAVMVSALLLSASGTGFVAVVFIALFWLISNFSNKRRNPVIFGFVVFVLALLSYFFIDLQSGGLFQGFSRISSNSEFSTLYIRVIRPFEVYFGLDFFHQLFGLGYGNYAEFLAYTGAFNDYEQLRNVAWTNSAVFILSGAGLIGFLIYMAFHLSVYSRSNTFNKGIVVFILMHLVYSDLPVSIFYVAMMSFVVSALPRVSARKLRLAGDF